MNMILNQLYNQLPKENREDFVVGLVAGFLAGLLFGLLLGLVAGFLAGLLFGLVAGLLFGLLFGSLVGFLAGLLFGLLLGLVAEFLFGLLNFINLPLIIFLLIVAEIFFFLDRDRPSKKDNKILYTLYKKGESLLESSLIIVNVLNACYYLPMLWTAILEQSNVILQTLKYIGIGVAIILGIIGWVYLNSLKYSVKRRNK